MQLDAKSIGVVAAYDMYRECCYGELEPHWANNQGLTTNSSKRRCKEAIVRRRLVRQLRSLATHDARGPWRPFAKGRGCDDIDCDEKEVGGGAGRSMMRVITSNY